MDAEAFLVCSYLFSLQSILCFRCASHLFIWITFFDVVVVVVFLFLLFNLPTMSPTYINSYFKLCDRQQYVQHYIHLFTIDLLLLLLLLLFIVRERSLSVLAIVSFHLASRLHSFFQLVNVLYHRVYTYMRHRFIPNIHTHTYIYMHEHCIYFSLTFIVRVCVYEL